MHTVIFGSTTDIHRVTTKSAGLSDENIVRDDEEMLAFLGQSEGVAVVHGASEKHVLQRFPSLTASRSVTLVRAAE